MILASSGIIASQIASFDADALAFFARVTAEGGTLSVTEKSAVNKLVLDLKANSLWTPMKAIYPMVGASAAACSRNLKSDTFNGTFTSNWIFSATGATPNGSSDYMDTGFNSFAQSVTESFGIYARTTQSGVKIPIGSREGNKQNYIGNAFGTMNIRGTGGSSTGVNSLTKGFICIYDSDDSTNQYTNLSGVKNTGTRVFSGSPNSIFYIGAWNNEGTPAFFSSIELAFSFIANRITDTQASNLYTAVQTFQTTLSRNV